VATTVGNPAEFRDVEWIISPGRSCSCRHAVHNPPGNYTWSLRVMTLIASVLS